MCGRFNLTASGEEIAEAFDLDETDAASGRRHLARLNWGLVPEGAPETDRGFINARAETAWQKPSFRDAFARRRCLIPATGFYEWQSVSMKPKRRQPWVFSLASGRPFAFAGLWEPPARDGASPTCTILTTEPNEVTRPVHDRMPVILAPEGYGRWLDPEPRGSLALRPLLRPYPAPAMTAWPVSTAVNNPRCDEPACLERQEDELPPLLR
jgi:putative SOS response-associated peptidase YedK